MIRYIPFLKAKRGELNAMGELALKVIHLAFLITSSISRTNEPRQKQKSQIKSLQNLPRRKSHEYVTRRR
jgi:hypothetical protein